MAEEQDFTSKAYGRSSFPHEISDRRHNYLLLCPLSTSDTGQTEHSNLCQSMQKHCRVKVFAKFFSHHANAKCFSLEIDNKNITKKFFVKRILTF